MSIEDVELPGLSLEDSPVVDSICCQLLLQLFLVVVSHFVLRFNLVPLPISFLCFFIFEIRSLNFGRKSSSWIESQCFPGTIRRSHFRKSFFSIIIIYYLLRSSELFLIFGIAVSAKSWVQCASFMLGSLNIRLDSTPIGSILILSANNIVVLVFEPDLPLVVFEPLQFPLLQDIALVLLSVDDVKVIVGGVSIFLLSGLMGQRHRFHFLGQDVARVVVYDVVIDSVFVVVLLRRKKCTINFRLSCTLAIYSCSIVLES